MTIFKTGDKIRLKGIDSPRYNIGTIILNMNIFHGFCYVDWGYGVITFNSIDELALASFFDDKDYELV